MTAASLTGAAVGYGGRVVVDGIDLELPPGASLALVGTNGSGKSTLLRTLVGLLDPCGGKVRVLGGRPGAAPERVGYLGQFHASGSVLQLRAADVVRMGRFAGKGLLGRLDDGDRRLVREALERMGAAAFAGEPVASLSGGQRQRVYIAQALARRADLLVLDEPAASLDAAGRALLDEALAAERRRGAAIVTATHDIGDAMRSDLVLLLARRVVALGPPRQVLTPEALLQTFGLAIRALEGGIMVMDSSHGHGEGDPTPHDH
ncbi:MAG: metal ABC transporter ATP-binding protein [Thermoleophilia bacterium]|nr:metal ABC transporter ATP-binding protein [Thermoleophilia bacterium]